VKGRVPNFFIAGAPNTGTTSLYHYLRQHPQVFMCPVKEPSYFGRPESQANGSGNGRYAAWRRSALRRVGRLVKRSGTVATWDAYLRLFEGARNEPAIGEATPRYILLPEAARAIRERIPHAKIVFTIRDPADWLFTRYLDRFWPDRGGSFRQRFLDATRPRAEWASALLVGRYATNLQRFYDVFPREQIQVHLYEDLRQNGRAVLQSILSFIGVDPQYPIDMSLRHNERRLPRFPRLHALRRRLFADFPLTQWFPPPARRLLRTAYIGPKPNTQLAPADRALVIDYYRDEIGRTAALTGRDLSAWLR
jgi:hypothetical protein